MSEKSKEKICRIGQITAALMGILAVSPNAEVKAIDQNEINKLQICIKSECAHWQKLHSAIEREDHSGGKELIFEEAVRTNRTPYREGPGGSTGYWKLDASGYCGLGGKP